MNLARKVYGLATNAELAEKFDTWRTAFKAMGMNFQRVLKIFLHNQATILETQEIR